MGLIILTTLLCLAHLSAATCPQYRPLTADQTCTTNAQCPSGKSCCAYSGSSYCVSTDPNTCITDGKIVKKGQMITLNDSCTTCDCHGYDDLICTDDGCIWPKEVPNMEAPQECPLMRPNSATVRCVRSNSCSAGYTCCKYFDGNFCTLADPNTCHHKGKPIARGKMVKLDDGCSQCECQGHDSLICTSDPCYWPLHPLRKGCNYGGQMRPSGATFQSTDGCNTCFCNEGRVMCTMKACIQLPLNQYPIRYPAKYATKSP